MADADSTTPEPADTPEPQDDQKPADEPKGDEGKGGKAAILADLAKERDARQALEQQIADLKAAQQTQLDGIAKALGLKSDDTPPDPATLTEQLTEEQTRAREAQVQLAVYRSPAAKEADVDGLLDSTSFQKALADVDPSDAEAVAAAVEAFVEANPRFKADGTKPRSPRPDPTQGRQPGQALDPIAADRAQIEADLAAARR